MINFATLKGVTIPQGVVTQISSGGVVLWKAGGGEITVRIKPVPVHMMGTPFANSTYARATINGAVYDGSAEVSITVASGTPIECYSATSSTGSTTQALTVDGVSMKASTDTNTSLYTYTANQDVILILGAYKFFNTTSGIVHVETGKPFYINKLFNRCGINGTWADVAAASVDLPAATRTTIVGGMVYYNDKQLLFNGAAVKASDQVIELGIYSTT